MKPFFLFLLFTWCIPNSIICSSRQRRAYLESSLDMMMSEEALYNAYSKPDELLSILKKWKRTNKQNYRRFTSFTNPITGQTCLMVMTQVGWTNVVSFLLQNKCVIKKKDKQGQTALDIARKKGFKDIIELLEPHFQSNSARQKKNFSDRSMPAPAKELGPKRNQKNTKALQKKRSRLGQLESAYKKDQNKKRQAECLQIWKKALDNEHVVRNFRMHQLLKKHFTQWKSQHNALKTPYYLWQEHPIEKALQHALSERKSPVEDS